MGRRTLSEPRRWLRSALPPRTVVRRLTSRSGRSDFAGVAAARWSVFGMDQVGLDQAAIDETPDTKSDHRLKPQQADQRKAYELYADPVHLCIREDRNEQRHAKRQRPREPLLGG